MELGGTRENRKRYFSQLWFFLGNSRYLAEARRGINSEEMKNIFLVQNIHANENSFLSLAKIELRASIISIKENPTSSPKYPPTFPIRLCAL